MTKSDEMNCKRTHLQPSSFAIDDDDDDGDDDDDDDDDDHNEF